MSLAANALNLIGQPVWIFDIDRRCVHWANTAALHVWAAPSLEELCARFENEHDDYNSIMAKALADRLAEAQDDGLLGLIDFAEDAFGHDVLRPMRRAALGEGAEVGGGGLELRRVDRGPLASASVRARSA